MNVDVPNSKKNNNKIKIKRFKKKKWIIIYIGFHREFGNHESYNILISIRKTNFKTFKIIHDYNNEGFSNKSLLCPKTCF